MIVREGRRRVVTVNLFMVGGFASSSMGDETPETAGVSAEVQLTREKQPLCVWHRGCCQDPQWTRGRGPPSRDVNSRAVLGCLHTGIGETHQNNLLCKLNIPSMNPETSKSRENEKPQKVCQLSAVDQSGLHCFDDYILPSRDVEIHVTRVNGLSVWTVRGVTTLEIFRMFSRSSEQKG